MGSSCPFAGVHAQSKAKTQRNKCIWKIEGDIMLSSHPFAGVNA